MGLKKDKCNIDSVVVRSFYKGYSFSESETCFKIWGCVPIDGDWAKGTAIFKENHKF